MSTVTLAAGTATVVVGPSALSEAALQTLIDGLAYLNTSENPTDANRVVTITQLVDSGSDTSPNDATLAPNIASTVNVNPVNDAPVNTRAGHADDQRGCERHALAPATAMRSRSPTPTRPRSP